MSKPNPEKLGKEVTEDFYTKTDPRILPRLEDPDTWIRVKTIQIRVKQSGSAALMRERERDKKERESV